jgi:VWFA-related protein
MRSNRFATWGRILLLIPILFASWTNAAQAQSAIVLVAHYVEVNSLNDGISYNIDIYLSVLESDVLVTGLQQEAFAIQEDGQKVDIQGLRLLTEEPVNIVLVLDTSANMSGPEMTDARSAAIAFISRLKPDDRLALVTYGVSAKNQVDELTTDHGKIVDIINNKIVATREASTCLYDAVHSALKMFTPQPAGSRAVVLLTNGRDETAAGANCSDHTADEVIANASEGELRAPLYVIALGIEDDTEDDLKNVEILRGFANGTGGMYRDLSSSSTLANTVDDLSTLFRAQYILTYTSTSVPGPHNVLVSINSPNQPIALGSDTRNFPLPPLSPHIAFNSPLDGETIGDILKIVVSLATQGDAVVERVAFDVNGAREGEDDTKPYEIELDAKKYPAGQMTITATAYGANNTELARSSINVVRAEAVVVETAPTDETIPLSHTPAPNNTPAASNNLVVFMAIALGGLSILAIGVLIFYLLRQQKQSVIRELENYVGSDDALPHMQGIPAYRKVEEDRKAFQPEADPDVLGALTIEASDDPTLVGHRFEITASLVTLGRSADNDLNFPNDKPVSRHHAEIYQISGKLYLREVEMADASGAAKPPKYGTFLNQIPMGPDPAQLRNGDEIQLGKRVRLRFESHLRDMNGEALTYDEDDENRTATTDDVDKTAVQD